MMDADTLAENARDFMEQGDFSQAKACLRKAAELAPLRNDIRDMLTAAIQQEAIAMQQGDRTGRRGRTRASQGPLLPPETRRSKKSRVLWVMILLVMSVGCLGAGVWLSQNKDLMDRLGLGVVEETSDEGVLSSALPAPTPELMPSPTPTPTPDPMATKRQELLTELESLEKQGLYAKAAQTVEALFSTNPPDEAALRERLANCYFNLGEEQVMTAQNFQSALSYLKQAVQENPKHAKAYSLMGYCQYQMGCRMDETSAERGLYFNMAKDSLEKSIELDPDYLRSYETLALTYIKLLDNMSAARCYEQVIRRAPGTPEAVKAQTKLKMMQ